jgi:hypothetical protein
MMKTDADIHWLGVSGFGLRISGLCQSVRVSLALQGGNKNSYVRRVQQYNR